MKQTILVADGDAAIRSLIRDILSNRGYRVLTASTAVEALGALERGAPDVIFLDASLDGAEMVAGEAGRQGVPLVAVADGEESPASLTERLDAIGYLQKPVRREWLEMLARQGAVFRDCLGRGRRRAEDLSLSRGFLEAVLEADDGAIYLLDADGVLLRTNLLGEQMLQCAPDAGEAQRYLDLLSGHSSDLQGAALGRARDTGVIQRVEEHRGGTVYATRIRPVPGKGGPSGFVVKTVDISGRRRSEVELAESEKRYRSVYEACRDAIIMFDRNDGAVLDCNAAARRLYGYGAEEMLALTILELTDEPERSLEMIRAGVEHVPLRYHRNKVGVSFPVEVSMSHFVHNGREVCTAYIRDISQHKVVEEALREGARLYRAVVEDQTELICRYNTDNQVTFANGAFARFFGVDEDEIVGTEFFPHVAMDERRDLRSWLRDAGPDNPVFDREQHVRRHDGEARWILWTNRTILDYRGNIIEIQAVGRDITEQKDAERALALATEEKEQYRQNLEAIFRSIPDAIVSVDSQCRIIATNSAAASLLAVERERAVGLDFEEAVNDSGNPCLSVLKQVLKTSKAVRGYEAEIDLAARGQRMVELNCTPLIDHEKRHTGAVLVVRDVSRIADLEKRLQERHGFRGIIGRSMGMQEMYKLLEQLSPLDSIVLILGESGTGKELVAEALHYGGPRAGAPLIKVNCSALSESLLESELFGHVRGAFTGAVRDKVGRIQAAQGGTLFLDEIGDISPLIQLKLLRFLEQKEYERVGESKTRSADVRIIAATNVNLLQAVMKGTFREDLYYRLNVMPVQLPPLRDRQGDIPLLVEHFLEIFSGQFNKAFKGVSDEVMDLFMSYAWPGNVRELRHILEHACILSPGKEIGIEHMRGDLVSQMRTPGYAPAPSAPAPWSAPGVMPELAPAPSPYAQASVPPHYAQVPAPPVFPRKAGREEVLAALARCGWNKARAARELGIHRATLYRKLKAWGLDA
ncbi:sigma 54-interacting transcriptional regulator [Pseudodesulfovibrio cashew]|uniref:sigma 54-interacting transcriptional regulator n=1 Tax=Pseudodesulfovibrio cashew TaxID=2678688 RepID=UPI001F554197|nr:sigma 54-interacting transcriptional regulator [Pseudodesulfovibrio cashew]